MDVQILESSSLFSYIDFMQFFQSKTNPSVGFWLQISKWWDKQHLAKMAYIWEK